MNDSGVFLLDCVKRSADLGIPLEQAIHYATYKLARRIYRCGKRGRRGKYSVHRSHRPGDA